MGFGIKSAFKAGKKLVKKAGKAVGKVADAVGLDWANDKIVKPSLGIGKSLLKGEVQGATRKAFKPVGNALDGTLDESARLLRQVGMAPPVPLDVKAVPDPLVMPDIDEEAVNRARRRMIARNQGGGRTGTILGGTGTGIG